MHFYLSDLLSFLFLFFYLSFRSFLLISEFHCIRQASDRNVWRFFLSLSDPGPHEQRCRGISKHCLPTNLLHHPLGFRTQHFVNWLTGNKAREPREVVGGGRKKLRRTYTMKLVSGRECSTGGHWHALMVCLGSLLVFSDRSACYMERSQKLIWEFEIPYLGMQVMCVCFC